MEPNGLPEQISEQFSYSGSRADIWRGFDHVLATDAFLNLGYSHWSQPLLVGSSQERLATKLGTVLETHLPTTIGTCLLDIGCGRGGPAVHLADRFGFRVVGLDLVPYNVNRARQTAEHRGVDTTFVVGDASQLPVRSASFPACLSIDSIVYLPRKRSVFGELATALEQGGILVMSDLLMQPSVTETERQTVTEFADAWDMPRLVTLDEYRSALTESGFSVRSVDDVTPNSVGRFRKWTSLYLAIAGMLGDRVLDHVLRSYGLDPTTISEQVRRAHEALPFLRHVIVVAET